MYLTQDAKQTSAVPDLLQLYNNHPDTAYRQFTNQLVTTDKVLTIYPNNVYRWFTKYLLTI